MNKPTETIFIKEEDDQTTQTYYDMLDEMYL